MSIFNELVLKEAVYLYTDILALNPIIPDKMSVFTYDSIDGNGAYEELKMYIGSDIPFDELIPFPIGSNDGKILKSGTMSSDYVFIYTVTAGDIATLGSNIIVSQVIINNELFPASVIYEDYPLSDGDTITLTGLPAMASVSSLRFILQ